MNWHVANYVTINKYNGKIEHEQIVAYILTEWRGEPAVVEMQATRYRTDDGDLTGWNVFAKNATKRTSDTKPLFMTYTDPDLTGTARTRLGAQYGAEVVNAIESNQEVVFDARRRGVLYAIKSMARDLGATDMMRKAVVENMAMLTDDDVTNITQATLDIDHAQASLDKII